MDDEQLDDWRRTWTIGNYPALGDLWAEAGRDTIADLDAHLGLAGRDLVDVATGHGTTAIAAARHGAHVIGVDLTPRLMEEAGRRAAAAGLTLRLVEGDFHALPLGDGTADVVTSTFGVFLSPEPSVAAQELARIVRRDGLVAVTAWRADGAAGDMVSAIAEVRGIDVDTVRTGWPDTAAWGHEPGLVELFAGTDMDVVTVTHHDVVIPTDDVGGLLALFMTASGPWMQLRDVQVDNGVAWADVEASLLRRWRARLTGAGLPMGYTRALLQRRAG